MEGTWSSKPLGVSEASVGSNELWIPNRRGRETTTKGVGTRSQRGNHFGGNPGCGASHRGRLIARSATCPGESETTKSGRGTRPEEIPGTKRASSASGSVETLQNPYVSCRAIGKARASRGPGEGRRTGIRRSGSCRGEYRSHGLVKVTWVVESQARSSERSRLLREAPFLGTALAVGRDGASEGRSGTRGRGRQRLGQLTEPTEAGMSV